MQRGCTGGKSTSNKPSLAYGQGSFCEFPLRSVMHLPRVHRNILPSYVVLTTLQTLYAYFVEGHVIFVGRRKTFSKRIITERITISSRTIPVSSPSLRKSSSNAPSYSLNITYLQSTSSGKSLLCKNRTQGSKEYSAFFDDRGVMAQDVFERWAGELVEGAMEGKST